MFNKMFFSFRLDKIIPDFYGNSTPSGALELPVSRFWSSINMDFTISIFLLAAWLVVKRPLNLDLRFEAGGTGAMVIPGWCVVLFFALVLFFVSQCVSFHLLRKRSSQKPWSEHLTIHPAQSGTPDFRHMFRFSPYDSAFYVLPDRSQKGFAVARVGRFWEGFAILFLPGYYFWAGPSASKGQHLLTLLWILLVPVICRGFLFLLPKKWMYADNQGTVQENTAGPGNGSAVRSHK